ncbi:MAG: ribosome biogenesis GTPase YlqF [Bacteriovoracaceae bacterium]|jgi:ribosome biogenesis GTPase A|nr:ribosome biogenesis GTPase YlqF [Bacteriovoracaceae bacterium]
MKKTKVKKGHVLNEMLVDEETKRINWFPGHMNKAVKKIKEKIKLVDIVLEVRDARSPLITANTTITECFADKSRFIVINKSNLADPEAVKKWEEWFKLQDVPFMFLDCFDRSSLKKVIAESKRIVKQRRADSDAKGEKKKLRMMIMGLPNTGKSTIINQLANRNACKAADKPGHTRTQLWVKVDDDLEILDTPGVMPPKIEKYEHGLWLTAIHAIPDLIVTTETSACFIIEHLLKLKTEEFKEKYKFETLDLTLIEALDHIAKVRGCVQHKGESDYDRVYKIVLIDFRKGNLGLISFGLPPKY